MFRPVAPPLPVAKPLPLDVSQTHVVEEFKLDIPLTTCRVDPDARYVFAGAEDFNVYRWQIGQPAESRATFAGHQSWVRSFDFSPDGRWLFTGGYDDRIGVWHTDADEPAPLQMIDAHKGWVRWVRVSPDGQRLASCGNDKVIRIWNLPDGTLQRELRGHDRYPYAVAFHPDNRRLVSFDLMGVIKEWDLETGAVSRQFEAKFMWGFDEKFRADMGGARDMEFSRDGKFLAVAGLTEVTNAFAGVHKPMVLLMDWESGEHAHRFKDDAYKGMAWGVRFHPDGFLIAIGSPQSGNNGLLWFWKPGEEKPFHAVTLSHGARGLDLLPDGQRLVVAQVDGLAKIYQMTARS